MVAFHIWRYLCSLSSQVGQTVDTFLGAASLPTQYLEILSHLVMGQFIQPGRANRRHIGAASLPTLYLVMLPFYCEMHPVMSI